MKKALLCGIKGTGMSNLALLLNEQGYDVLGLDQPTYFSTEAKLKNNKINYFENFELSNLENNFDLFIYSSAYKDFEIVKKAKEKFNSYSYPQYLAYLSSCSQTYAVSGTHGKSSTVALTTYSLSQGNRKNFPFYSIYGSNIIGEKEVTYQGSDNLIIEACEYQDHFLLYKLDGLLITNIEFDHPDYFKDINQMIQSYKNLIANLKLGGFLIINIDNYNNKKILKYAQSTRLDLVIITYGYQKNATVTIEEGNINGHICIPLMGREEYYLPTFSKPLISNYVASAILSACILLDRDSPVLYLDDDTIIYEEIFNTLFAQSLHILQDFIGISRRLELRGKSKNIYFFDDYAHHPTEIQTVYNELHLRYPGKKIISIFTPHTASRTKALLNDFSKALCESDVLILTSTFTARGDGDENDPSKILYEKIKKKISLNRDGRLVSIFFLDDEKQIIETCLSCADNNDIIISLGAANKTYIVDEIAEIINS